MIRGTADAVGVLAYLAVCAIALGLMSTTSGTHARAAVVGVGAVGVGAVTGWILTGTTAGMMAGAAGVGVALVLAVAAYAAYLRTVIVRDLRQKGHRP